MLFFYELFKGTLLVEDYLTQGFTPEEIEYFLQVMDEEGVLIV